MSKFSSKERLVVVHNPNSTSSRFVKSEVFDRLNDNDYSYQEIKTRFRESHSNIDDIATQIKEGDTVLVAAGDGTASQVFNSLIKSQQKDTKIGFLPYGNFNDMASLHMNHGDNVLDLIEADTVSVVPLEVSIDDNFWRYSPGHTTLGWSAIASGYFDNANTRNNIKNVPRQLKLALSFINITSNYLVRGGQHLPAFSIGRSDEIHDDITDIVALNHPKMASLFGAKQDFHKTNEFGYVELDLSHRLANIAPNLGFFARTLAGRAPLTPRESVDIRFLERALDLPIQTEGESTRVSANTLSITKNQKHAVEVLHSKNSWFQQLGIKPIKKG